MAALLRDAHGVEHGDSVEVARSKLSGGLETLGVGAEDRAAMVAALARVFGLEQDDARVRHPEPEQLKRQVLLFSLVASGQITLRRIDGWRKIATVTSMQKPAGA